MQASCVSAKKNDRGGERGAEKGGGGSERGGEKRGRGREEREGERDKREGEKRGRERGRLHLWITLQKDYGTKPYCPYDSKNKKSER